ncbi:MAG: 5-(carboxyamino)imidazole ribonucleotide synthase [Patescibacteria group bacterium]|jgi:5-(carboxyamino)imidazole ribonucleotide synthase
MQRLGILGGGQLGRMLIQAAMNYDIYVQVLDPDAEAPCHTVCNKFVQGSLTDYETVLQFGQEVDVITIEIEHVNVEALKALQKQGKKVYPQPEIIELIQDKGNQKDWYVKHSVPTAPFTLGTAEYTGKFPVMQKLRRLGYDGKGVKKIISVRDLSKQFTEPAFFEEFIPFQKEIAVIVARNQRGDIATYPVVEMKFHLEAHLVDWLMAPARVSKTIAEQAHSVAMRIAEELKLVGVLAVEMFVTTAGDVLVNEIAPRPHNSGHHTIEANETSQYDQHLRAIFNWPLGATTARQTAVMINLLGEAGYEGVANYQNLSHVLAEAGVYVHLYGKVYTRPMRKMGHITVLADDAQTALAKALALKQRLKVIS